MYTSEHRLSSGVSALWTCRRYGGPMRWDLLFADLEARADANESAQFDAEVRDLTRAERASVSLAARLVQAKGSAVTVTTRDGVSTAGVMVDAAAGWLLLGDSGPQTLVPLHAVTVVAGLGTRAAELTEVERRLGLGHALRALARDRARVVASTLSGDVTGIIGAVGADFIELSTGVGASVLIATDAVTRVRSAAL